ISSYTFILLLLFFSILPPPPRSTLFPYTTLFRSKNEVYRNWIVPQAALLGFRGHVDLEFTVERDGTLTDLKMLKSSGTPALDRADRKSTRLNSSHVSISYAVFCLKKKKKKK